MCGRYTQIIALDQLMLRFGFAEPSFTLPPRYNIAPPKPRRWSLLSRKGVRYTEEN